MIAETLEIIFQNDQELYREKNTFFYDDQMRISRLEMQATLADGSEGSSEMLFSDYNQYGEWTKVTIMTDSDSPTESIFATREIEYY
ncbi:hypothetical protein [Zophobihabitans entericus]|uniref:Uncharacterized protein n=1 Tax=Zophobihabitans entericus TaxID=1635327 RepID=A0A6G9I9C8_9GAMM|nr:hypothetical protein [Zophobihabitans entericus]QIQ20432.1 hypothetical protein IPMB12_01290 [Zophobihabitans entericus]